MGRSKTIKVSRPTLMARLRVCRERSESSGFDMQPSEVDLTTQLLFLKSRRRPRRVGAKSGKYTPRTSWEEVSVDCEGPEDYLGCRYSLTYLRNLSHAIMLDPMKSLTHSEVLKAFTRCIVRSRKIPHVGQK